MWEDEYSEDQVQIRDISPKTITPKLNSPKISTKVKNRIISSSEYYNEENKQKESSMIPMWFKFIILLLTIIILGYFLYVFVHGSIYEEVRLKVLKSQTNTSQVVSENFQAAVNQLHHLIRD